VLRGVAWDQRMAFNMFRMAKLCFRGFCTHSLTPLRIYNAKWLYTHWKSVRSYPRRSLNFGHFVQRSCFRPRSFAKNSRQSPLAATRSPTLRPLRIWGGEWGQRNASTLRDLKTTQKRQSRHTLVIGNWNITSLTEKEHELVEEAKRYFLDIFSISSTNRCGSNAVELDDG